MNLLQSIKFAIKSISSKGRNRIYFFGFVLILVNVIDIIAIYLIYNSINLFQGKNLNSQMKFIYFLNFNNLPKEILAIYLMMFSVMLFLAKTIISWIINYIISNLTFKEQVILSDKIFNEIVKKNFKVISNYSPQKFYYIYTTAINKLVSAIITNSIYLISEISLLFITSVLILILYPQISIVLITTFILGAFLIYLGIRKKIQTYGEERAKSSIILTRELNHFYEYYAELYFNQGLKYFEDKIRNELNRYYNFQVKQIFIQTIPRYVFEIIFVFNILLVTFISINLNGLRNSISVLILLLAASFRILPAVHKLNTTVLSLKASITDSKILISLIKDQEFFQDDLIKRKPIERKYLLENAKPLSVKNLSIKIGNQFILKNINFEVMVGEKIAIIGESGIGKTTFLESILGIKTDYIGDVKIFGIDNREDINIVSPYIHYSSQFPYVFNQTVRENILLDQNHNKEIDKNVMKIIKSTNLTRLYSNQVKLRYNKVKSYKYSGGERQKIAIAKALFRKARLIILDEPTSSLDMINSQQILKIIGKLDKKVSLIIVTHFNFDNKIFDKIYEIKDLTLKRIK